MAREYRYLYDALNRIKSADYQGAFHAPSNGNENYALAKVTYDKNGNILRLDRYGLKAGDPNVIMSSSTMGLMDRLTYKYAPKSNLLIDVHDTADIQPRAITNTFPTQFSPAQYYGGFKDQHTASDKYVYGDLNGNMTADKNKDIVSISYNHLNLPSVVTFTNNRNITYIYDATGVKLKKVITQSATSTNTEYAGGIIYENGTLEMIPQPEGYIQPGINGGYDYVYQYKDYLGNIRVSYSDLDGNNYVDSSEILSEKHYYPFGMTQKGYGAANSSMASSAALKYGFGGKELQDELGLEWYDITARNYDAALGRWMNIDPLADIPENISYSPYIYVWNNPLRNIDPDGRTGQDVIITGNESGQALTDL